MHFDNPVSVPSSFSLEGALDDSARQEQVDATSDTGPISGGDRATLERAYDLFYGTTPLTRSASLSPIAEQPQGSLDLDAVDAALSKIPSKRQRCLSPQPSRSTGAPAADASGASKKRRDKKKAKKRRRLLRQQERMEDRESARMPATSAAANHIYPADEEVTTYDAASIPSASTGYIAQPEKKDRVYTLAELMDMGFRVVEWDGRQVACAPRFAPLTKGNRTSRPITDANGRVVAVLAGQPTDASWAGVHEEALQLLEKAGKSCSFSAKAIDHRRGNFPALNVGISFGGGQMAPGNLYHTPKRADILRDLNKSAPFRRIAGFASKTFKTWMPDLYDYYNSHFEDLLAHDSELIRNFDNSVWAAVAYNFGPHAVTARHRDFANIPFGICSVTALGDYDPKLGGHIVLWELGLVVQFPPGSTVLILSAAIAHSNTPISSHEKRASFTQYTAGGLIRWVEHGFQLDAEFKKDFSDEEEAELAAGNEQRRKLGLSLLPTLASLRRRYP